MYCIVLCSLRNSVVSFLHGWFGRFGHGGGGGGAVFGYVLLQMFLVVQLCTLIYACCVMPRVCRLVFVIFNSRHVLSFGSLVHLDSSTFPAISSFSTFNHVDYSLLCVPSSALLSFSRYLRPSTSSSSSSSSSSSTSSSSCSPSSSSASYKFSTLGSSTVYLQRGPFTKQGVAPLATCVLMCVRRHCLIVLHYWPPLFCLAALFVGPSFFLLGLLSLVEGGVSDGIFNISQCCLSFSGLLVS
jgi:hypothetical protein